MGLWHQATWPHPSGMLGSQRRLLLYLLSATSSGPLQVHLQQWQYSERWTKYWRQKDFHDNCSLRSCFSSSSPSSSPVLPAARKYNMFMAQVGCAAIGVLAFSIFGPGWLARSAALAASLAFMIYTRATHPPAASLPLLFIDGVKLHHLNLWYALFPGATGCIILCLITNSLEISPIRAILILHHVH
ncbi:hypothetical protein GH714_021999 [Hevea brasiliensis]|uniref:HPP transmembrane region domain-containing protein n=1 Tax=Hevea brasiliensis TaxID=3981 RepID=A0A6A6MG52_HEVBR|nr:hypothetical protein GH714_021999 [Hevea brasiliensis]